MKVRWSPTAIMFVLTTLIVLLPICALILFVRDYSHTPLEGAWISTGPYHGASPGGVELVFEEGGPIRDTGASPQTSFAVENSCKCFPCARYLPLDSVALCFLPNTLAGRKVIAL
jgi:hypothetical protein